MRRGNFNKRVTIQRSVPLSNAHNEQVDAWQDIQTRWTAIIYSRGEERRVAASTNGNQSASFVMLADSTTKAVTLRDRLFFAGDPWNIVGILPPRNGEIEFTAVRSL